MRDFVISSLQFILLVFFFSSLNYLSQQEAGMCSIFCQRFYGDSWQVGTCLLTGLHTPPNTPLILPLWAPSFVDQPLHHYPPLYVMLFVFITTILNIKKKVVCLVLMSSSHWIRNNNCLNKKKEKKRKKDWLRWTIVLGSQKRKSIDLQFVGSEVFPVSWGCNYSAWDIYQA